MRCFKLLGERVMARDFDRQVAELQVRAAVLNRFTRLGTPITVPVLQKELQIASARPSLDLLNKASNG
jgi:chromosome condensin MukBEF MukE localization factor